MSIDNAVAPPLPEAVRERIQDQWQHDGYRALITNIAEEAYRMGWEAAAQQERARHAEAHAMGYASGFAARHDGQTANPAFAWKQYQAWLASHPPPPEDEISDGDIRRRIKANAAAHPPLTQEDR